MEVAALLPVAVLQGRRLRRTTPVLPEAPGPREGDVGTGEPLRLVCLGDSTIAGVGLDDSTLAVTCQLARRLAHGHHVTWRAVGRTGATAATARSELVPLLTDSPADVLVLSVGVNDVLRGRSQRRFVDDVQGLIEAARARVGRPLVVLSGLPPVHRFPLLPPVARRVAGHRARALDAGLAKVAAADAGVVHHILQFDTDEGMFAADGFHPGPPAHAVWAEQLAAVISAGTRPA